METSPSEFVKEASKEAQKKESQDLPTIESILAGLCKTVLESLKKG